MSGSVQRGYLQRLAATAVQPQPRVHPFATRFPASHFPANRLPSTRFDSSQGAESTSSPLSLESSSEIVLPAPPASPLLGHASELRSSGPTEAAASMPATHADATRVDAIRAVDDRPYSSTSRSAPPAALSTAADRAEHASPATFQPLLPGQGIAAPPLAPTIVSAAQNLGTVAEASAGVRPVPPSAQSGASAAAPATSAPTPWNFTPLVAASVSASTAISGPAGNNGPQSRLSSRRDTPPSVPTTPSRRSIAPAVKPQRNQAASSDDIQIHIGRIEVIAVPPPAPRPVPAPARKSLSLDEYLQGSHGRSA